MAHEYIPREWAHGRPAWNRTKGLIQDYDRLVLERQNILYGGSRPPDGMPKGTNIGNPTEQKGIRLARISEDLEAIDRASMEFRGRLSNKVREGFDPVRAFWSYDYYNYQHIRKDEHDYGPCRRTWHNYKVGFMVIVAENAKII